MMQVGSIKQIRDVERATAPQCAIDATVLGDRERSGWSVHGASWVHAKCLLACVSVDNSSPLHRLIDTQEYSNPGYDHF